MHMGPIKRAFFTPSQYHAISLNVTFNYLKFDGWKELLIGSILSTQSAAVSFYNF